MPELFLLLPLLGIFIQNIPSRKTGGKIAPWVSGLVCAAIMAMAATHSAGLWQSLSDTLKLPFGASLSIGDFTTAVVLFTVGLIALISVIVNAGRDSLNFSNLLLVSVMGMSGIAMVRDLFTLYLFLEITSVASWLMISMRKDNAALEGAFKYLMLSAVATVMMLSALSAIFLKTHSLSYQVVGDYLKATAAWPLSIKAGVALLSAGFMVKAGVVPFHAWVPGAYSSSPPAVSVMLAGIVTKAGGVYAILRMALSVFADQTVGVPFMALGAVSIVVGALAAMGQKDMKKMLAWSSISQVGYIVLAAGAAMVYSGDNAKLVVFNMAAAGALLHFFNHASFKSLLFVNAAAVEEQTGTRQIDQLGGLASKMKITGATSVVGFLSTAGVPPLSGFWSKLLIILALYNGGQVFYAVVALLASILTLAYFLILQRNVFFGKLKEGLEGIREGGANYTVPALILAGITVLVGVLFPVVMNWLAEMKLF